MYTPKIHGKYELYRTCCSYACSYYNVHQCLQQPTKDVLRQNDRHLADIQPPSSLHWSSGPFLYGHPQVPSLIIPFYVGRSISKVQNRNDDDREVNHHGRSIEVGEAGTDEKENDLILLQIIPTFLYLTQRRLILPQTTPTFLYLTQKNQKIWIRRLILLQTAPTFWYLTQKNRKIREDSLDEYFGWGMRLTGWRNLRGVHKHKSFRLLLAQIFSQT